jgi:hypothetical protein
MENPLSKLAIDHWYKALMAAGLGVFLVNGAGALKAYPALEVGLLSAGTFFFGLGEWMSHPLQTTFYPATAYRPGGIATSYPRRFSLGGLLFDILGLGLVGLGIYRCWR